MLDVCVYGEKVLICGFPSLSGLLVLIHDVVSEPSISGAVKGHQEGALRVPLDCGIGDDQDEDDTDKDKKANTGEAGNVLGEIINHSEVHLVAKGDIRSLGDGKRCGHEGALGIDEGVVDFLLQ